ncbi:MAG: nucleotide exchange factor GrpE [Chlamydiae bacterium]|nr:nucleotide exchange factor GrpE [Chlamydiota bacterium]
MNNGPENAPPSQEEPEKTTTCDELVQLQQELQEQKEKYLRSLAEIENTKKRLQKERQEMVKFAVENVIIDFLEPLDSLEKALSFTEHMSEETRNWAMGFKMILMQLQNVLSEHDVHPFDAVGKSFDPHLHEAVETKETEDLPEGTIVEQFAKGYKTSDRTLRPARVKVAKKPQKEENTSSEASQDI